MIRFWKNNKIVTIIFFIIFLLLFLIYQYHTILFLRPQSIHQWRQTICLSIALNYYQQSMNFFTSEVHHMISDGGKTGHAVAEFPLIYYLNAILWKIFGIHEFIPRLVNIIICLFGSFYLFKILSKILSPIWALMICLLFFSSPIVAFYANNYLVDIPSLFICFVSAHYFFRYYESGEAKDIYFFMFFSLLVLLLKATAGLFFIVTLAIFVLEKLKVVKFEKQIFKQPLRDALLFISTLIISIAWYKYVFYFNSIHGGIFSVQDIAPIWWLDFEGIKKVLIAFFEITYHQFFNPVTSIIYLFLILILIFLWQRINKIYFFITAFLLFGCLIYGVLWFKVWDSHDYYLFLFLLPFPFVFISLGDYFKKNYPEIFYSWKTKFIFLGFLLLNIWYCSNNIRMRYGISTTDIPAIATKTEIDFWKWFKWNYSNTMEAYESIETYNKKLGIKTDDLIICVPDISVCITLYLMNQKGWNEYGNHIYNNGDIEEKINLGAKYLFIGDTALTANPVLNPYTKYKIGQYKNVAIFDLRQYRKIN